MWHSHPQPKTTRNPCHYSEAWKVRTDSSLFPPDEQAFSGGADRQSSVQSAGFCCNPPSLTLRQPSKRSYPCLGSTTGVIAIGCAADFTTDIGCYKAGCREGQRNQISTFWAIPLARRKPAYPSFSGSAMQPPTRASFLVKYRKSRVAHT